MAKGPDWALLHFDETSRHDDESKRDPHAGDLYVFRGRSGSLIRILWHDGVGISLYAKRLERGRFISCGLCQGIWA
jgi:transposase